MSDYSNIGFGYDEFNPPAYNMSTVNNYNKKPRTEKPRTFESRVAAKKGKSAPEKTKNIEEHCNCADCMPREPQPHICESCKDGAKKCGIFSQITQQDCIIIFVIFIVLIVLYSMYTMCCKISNMMQVVSRNYPNYPNPSM